MKVRGLVMAGVGVLLLTSFGILFSVLWSDSRALTHPPGYGQPDPQTFTFSDTPETVHGLAYEDVDFSAENGAVLRGWHVPTVKGSFDLGVVALHARGGDRRSLLPHLHILHEAGAGVLLFDFRENGLSDGTSRGTGLAVREAQDAISAVQNMRERGYEKIVLMGCSLGASAAILVAASESAVDGVIAESTISRFERYAGEEAHRRFEARGIEAHGLANWWGGLVVRLTRWRAGLEAYQTPEEAISAIAPRPVLLIHGKNDPWVVWGHSEELKVAAGENARLWLIEGAEHCDGLETDPDGYREQVSDFLENVVGGRSLQQ